jgi:hypothetical protein
MGFAEFIRIVHRGFPAQRVALADQALDDVELEAVEIARPSLRNIATGTGHSVKLFASDCGRRPVGVIDPSCAGAGGAADYVEKHICVGVCRSGGSMPVGVGC